MGDEERSEMSKYSLSKDTVHHAIGGIVIVIIGFVIEIIWKEFIGPDMVIIMKNENFQGDTAVTIVKFEGDSAAIEAFNNY